MKHIFIFTAIILILMTGSISLGKTPPAFVLSVVDSLDNNKCFIHTYTMLNTKGDSIRHKIQYFDELGKPIQTIHPHISPAGGDLITATTYDSMGRITRQWLPLYMQSNNGAFLATSNESTIRQYADSLPYQRFEYNHLPESRVIAQTQAGEAWHNKAIQTTYLVNDNSNDLNCRYYLIDDNGNLSEEGFYEPGILLVKKDTDEDGKSVYTFVDINHKTILTRTINGSTSHDTYYVYHRAKENLCYVLTPMYQDHPDLDLYAYQYQYDEHDRCVRKKQPGASAIRYVYDKADHMVCYQDGNQKTLKEWTFYIQDKMGRNVIKGIANTLSTDIPSIQNKLVFATRSQEIGNMSCGYIIHNLAEMSNIHPKEINYYDDYNFLSLENTTERQNLEYGFSDFPLSTDSIKNEFSSAYMPVSGLQSGQRTYMENGKYLSTAFYYDKKGKLVQKRSKNHLGGYDVEFYTYSFTGLMKSNIHVHTIPGKDVVTEYYNYVYDNGDRLKEVLYRLNDGQEMILSKKEYNKLCQLKNIRLNNGKTVLNYDYNIRGWMTSIDTPHFKQKIHYVDGTGTPYFNGNISSITWNIGDDETQRGYKFSYDEMNRMTDAIYAEGSKLTNNPNCFNEQVTAYDKQGNILGLKRYGKISATNCGLINNLSLTYEGNQLKKVKDNAINSAYHNEFEFMDEANQTTEYTYDSNGNLIKDLNKKITEITYNWLNLPQKITFENGNTITYTYDADGTKLRTIHNVVGKTITTDYCDNAIYENGELKILLIETGYISFPDKKLHNFIKDHQGNIRVVINEDGQKEETTNYYPFGGIFASNSSIQPYKYNGKELDTQNCLNWYDYGTRMYDPSLGRWHMTDPSAEKYYSDSPYNYCGNEPIGRTDPDGSEWIRDRFGFYMWDKATDQESTRDGWTFIGPSLPKVTDSYHILEEINGGLYHKNTINPLASLVNLIAGEDIMVEKKAYDPVEEHMMQQAVETGTEIALGAVTGKVAGKIVSKVLSKTRGKGFQTFAEFKDTYGAAGDGKAWHHIVEQNQSNITKFGAENIHNTKNLIKLPHGKGSIHNQISGFYSSKPDFTNGLTVRKWLSTQSYKEQYEFGIKQLNKLGWKP